MLRGNFKGKDLIKISVKTDDATRHLYFEALTTQPAEERQLAKASDAT